MDAKRNAVTPVKDRFSPVTRNNLIATFILYCVAAVPAHATLINFDELIQAPCTQESCDPTPVDNQYAALGVMFINAAVYQEVTAPQIVSQPNAVSDWYGPGMQIHFTGALPTTVSMYVSAVLQDSIYLTAYGPGGQIGSATTDGWRGTEETSTPYRDQQLITFSGIGAISQINLDSFFSRRGTVVIDDLQFGNQANVPLPATLGLFVSGMGCLMLRARNRQ